MKATDYLMMAENIKRTTKTYQLFSLNFVSSPWSYSDEEKEKLKEYFDKEGDKVAKLIRYEGTIESVIHCLYALSLSFALGFLPFKVCVRDGAYLSYEIMKNGWEKEYNEIMSMATNDIVKIANLDFIVDANANRFQERTIKRVMEGLKEIDDKDLSEHLEPLLIDTKIKVKR